MRYLFLLLAFLAVTAEARNPRGGAVGSTGAPLPSVSGLHVSSNKLVNSSGQVVPLRGVDKDGAEYMCLSSGGTAVFDGPTDANDISNMGSWAIDIVRLPVNEQCWLGINGLPAASYSAATYISTIVSYVNALTAANIAVIIDLQWAAPGTTQSNQLTPMPDADHAGAFWTSVANTFKTNSSVLFDLFNEPYPDSNQDTTAAWICLRDGGTCPSVSYSAAGMQSLVTAIRATGATNVIMSPGIQFTNSLTQWLTYKPVDNTGNLIASWHSYASQICNSQTCWDTYILPVINSVPVIAGEIGESDCAHSYIDTLMAYMDSKGGNYLGWAWNTYDCSSFPSLISEYPGATPTGFGVGLRDHLLLAAGRTPPPLPPIPYFNNAVFPYGVAVGRGTNYTASDSTVYYADVAASGLTIDTTTYGFPTYSTANTITGTSDPTLYQTGRWGVSAVYNFAVPNGNYHVTLGFAPVTAFTQGTVNNPATASINNLGEFGQDQSINGNNVGQCYGSSFSGTNNSPYSSPATSCPGNVTSAAPTVNAAITVTYAVSVFGQHLQIQPAASFGGGRKTILNSIKITTP